MAGDHADVPFVQALKYGEGRPDGPPIWIVWHTMEEHEVGDTAERVAHYFATLPDGRIVSAHYCHDNNSSVQCVPLNDRAWTAGNRPGNNRGINVELAGFASQRAEGWADDYSQSMLRRACEIARRDMRRFGIPNRWCTAADLVARRGGHTTHNDLRLAFNVTTHTDPGPSFPRQLVLDLVAGTAPAATRPKGETVLLIKTNDSLDTYRSDGLGGYVKIFDSKTLEALKAAGHPVVTVDTIAQLNDATGGPWTPPVPPAVDIPALVAQLVPALVPPLVEQLGPLMTGATAAEVETIVDRELDEQSRAGADDDTAAPTS